MEAAYSEWQVVVGIILAVIGFAIGGYGIYSVIACAIEVKKTIKDFENGEK